MLRLPDGRRLRGAAAHARLALTAARHQAALCSAIALRTDPFHAALFVVDLVKARGLTTVIDELLKAIAQHMPRPLAVQVPGHLKKLGRRREERTLAGLLTG
ncbi:hypothetical protein [Streptomyces sp. NPDC048312]|uniref:hypothetical protein n=1 Tax=Streptomyces sp. NPDC048312 TaxID=3155485 RepID=UPI0033FA9498